MYVTRHGLPFFKRQTNWRYSARPLAMLNKVVLDPKNANKQKKDPLMITGTVRCPKYRYAPMHSAMPHILVFTHLVSVSGAGADVSLCCKCFRVDCGMNLTSCVLQVGISTPAFAPRSQLP